MVKKSVEGVRYEFRDGQNVLTIEKAFERVRNTVYIRENRREKGIITLFRLNGCNGINGCSIHYRNGRNDCNGIFDTAMIVATVVTFSEFQIKDSKARTPFLERMSDLGIVDYYEQILL